MFEQFLKTVFLISSWMALGYSLYFFVLSFFSLRTKKRDYPIIEDKQRFCIFIPCHNEEDVIASTVENMSKIDYDKSLADFFIIADNCSDKTAINANKKIAALGLKNFTVLERNVTDGKKKGKPHALRWGIAQLEEKDGFYSKYDMFMIFDADNFTDPNILKEMNSQYEHAPDNKKPCMIQCYLDSKNSNNIIAKGYNYAYRIFSNRVNQLSKRQIGMNASIGGTGFSIRMDFLKSIGGFSAKSLTEDLEMQTIANINDKYIYYNPYARAYDEKPTGFGQSYVQKTRWSQGHWFVCFKYVFILFLSVFRSRSLRSFFSKIDNIIYLFANVFLLSWFFNIISHILMLCCGYDIPSIFGEVGAGVKIVLALFALYSTVIYPYIAIKQDGNESEKRYTLIKLPYVYVCLFLSSFIYTLSALKGLFTWHMQDNWAKTRHVQATLSNGDIPPRDN